MRMTRFYTGNDGESHFEDIDISLKNIGGNEQRSDTLKATGIIFREIDAEYNWQWHNAPCRQFVITLQGQVEIMIGDGNKRQFGPGDVMLAEDTSGRGHISRALNDQPRISIFVTLE
jgi:hypothetical protein